MEWLGGASHRAEEEHLEKVTILKKVVYKARDLEVEKRRKDGRKAGRKGGAEDGD